MKTRVVETKAECREAAVKVETRAVVARAETRVVETRVAAIKAAVKVETKAVEIKVVATRVPIKVVARVETRAVVARVEIKAAAATRAEAARVKLVVDQDKKSPAKRPYMISFLIGGIFF